MGAEPLNGFARDGVPVNFQRIKGSDVDDRKKVARTPLAFEGTALMHGAKGSPTTNRGAHP